MSRGPPGRPNRPHRAASPAPSHARGLHQGPYMCDPRAIHPLRKGLLKGGVMGPANTPTPTSPASARAPPSKKSASTATSSPPAATSARRLKKTTASPSRKRWPGSPSNGASSKPRRGGWTPQSRRIWRGWGLVQGKAAVPKVREAIQMIEQEGWRLIRTRGSHRQFKHRSNPVV